MDLVVDDLGLVLGADAGQESALGLRDAQAVEGLLDVLGDVVPRALGALGGAHEVVDVVEVDLGQHRRAPSRLSGAKKWSSAFRRKSRIHCGSFLNSEIFSTISLLIPLGAL